MDKIKLLAPAGDLISLRAAIDAGCDEVYLGLKVFSMRANAKNFSFTDLKKAVKICHNKKVKVYVAINTIIYQKELKKLEKTLQVVKNIGVDAIIAWDMAVISIADKLGFEIHLSTQASVSNYNAVKFYKNKIKNLKRIVLARECQLDDITKIISLIKKEKLGIDIETFIHGAMCVSISGRCFMSQYIFNKSANRGECLQPCRRKYSVKNDSANKFIIKDLEEKHEFELGQDYVMSPNDLCSIQFIDKLIDSGIFCFKIEGRNRSPEYVSTVVTCYRTVIDYYLNNKSKIKSNKKLPEKEHFENLKSILLDKLKTVYYRGFSSGFYMGKPLSEWSGVYGSKSKEYKLYVGKVLNYYSKINVCELKVESNTFKLNDSVIFIGPTTGVFRQVVKEIHDDTGKISQAKKNTIITIKTNKKVRKNDLLYKVVLRNGV
jgi:U32 family peptidase